MRRASFLAFLAAASCNAIIGNEDRVLRSDDGGASPEAGAQADAEADGGPGGPGDAAIDAPQAGPVVVAKAKRPEQVAVVNGILYFTHEGGVSWCPPDDCAAPQTFFEGTGEWGFAADEGGVVAVSPSAGLLYAYPLKYAGTGQSLLATLPSPVGVAIDASFVYVTTASGDLYRCGRTSCPGGAVLVARGTAPGGAVAVGSGVAVWGSVASPDAGGGFLQQVDKAAVDGGAITRSFGRTPRALVLTGSRLIWSAIGGPAQYAGEVSRRDQALDSTTEQFYALQLGDPWGVAVDDTHVYFTVSGAGTVRRCPLGGCKATPDEVIATGQGHPHGVAVDASFVYWASSDGAVMRARKP